MTDFGAGFRVLVADDQESARERLVRALKIVGFAVDAASGRTEALEYWRHEPYDLIVVDPSLEGGCGLALADELRQSSPSSEVAIVVMPAEAALDSAVDALRAGASEYLPKSLESSVTLLKRFEAVTCALRGRKERAAERREALSRDTVTGIWNHSFFNDCLDREIGRCERSGKAFSLLLIDVDHFSRTNATYGHAMGDRLLCQLAEILTDTSRRADMTFQVGGEQVTARYGADVFGVILPDTPKRGATAKAEILRRAMANYDFSARSLPTPTVSIGVASFPEDGADPDSLISAAELAVRAAKKSGRDRSVAFSPAIGQPTTSVSESMDLEVARLVALDTSIDRGSFKHVYQPIVRADSLEVFAYESLCRPIDPAFSNPMELIATAHSAGRMADLGRALRAGTVVNLRRLPEPQALFINIDPLELNDRDLLGDHEEAVLLNAKRIVLEITESSAIENYELFRDILKRLKAKGFRIAVDDLGAGYAGLNSLAMLEPDFVKLDMGLVRGIHSDSRSARLIKHILEFAEAEGMVVICEGIETVEEKKVVEELGCPLMQGYYFGKPAPDFIVPAL